MSIHQQATIPATPEQVFADADADALSALSGMSARSTRRRRPSR